MAKIELTQFKGIFSKLGFLKSYSSLVLPGVILIAGFVVLAVTLLLGSSFKKKMEEESIPLGQSVKRLSQSAVPLSQVEIEKEYQQAWEADANQITLLARQTTQRELLSYKIFPEPKDTSMLIFDEFGRLYREGIEDLIESVNGRDCPTDVELEQSLQRTGTPRRRRTGGRRPISRSRGVDATITDALCREKAESASVYVNASDLPGYELWGSYKYNTRKEAVEDCWYWQLAYWIIEDVFETVKAMDSGSSSVYTSPVKRVLWVSFSGGKTTTKGSGSRAGGEEPVYVREAKDGLADSFTGRVSNDKIDVVHFELSVLVDSKAVLGFMKELCSVKKHVFRGHSGSEAAETYEHNQITVLESTTSAVDMESDEHSLYRYGDDSVVELDLICEYILERSGHDALKPEAVKEVVEEKKDTRRR